MSSTTTFLYYFWEKWCVPHTNSPRQVASICHNI